MHKKLYLLTALALSTPLCASAVIDLAHASVEPEKNLSLPTNATMPNEGGQPSLVINNTEGAIVSAKGEKLYYDRSGEALVTRFGSCSLHDYTEKASEIIFGEDGYIYMINPIYGYPTGTYIKGKKEGSTVTFEFPQCLGVDNSAGSIYVYRMVPNPDYDGDDMWLNYIPDPDCQTITFELDEDGIFIEEETTYYDDKETYPAVVMGLCNKAGGFTGMSDWNVMFGPFNKEVVKVPSNVDMEPYVLNCTWDTYMTALGFDGDTVYLRGIYNSRPDAVIKGTVDGDILSFPSGQFLGYSAAVDDWVFVLGCNYELVWNDKYHYEQEVITPKATIDCVYDRENDFVTGERFIGISTKPDTFNYTYTIFESTMKPQPASIKPSYPSDPKFLLVSYNNTQTVVYFDFYKTDTEGYYLNPDYLYYRLFVDGDVFLFSQDEFPSIEGTTTLIPYMLDDNKQFDVASKMHTVKLPLSGLETIGLQTLYITDDSEVVSNIVTYDVATKEQTTTQPEEDPIDLYAFGPMTNNAISKDYQFTFKDGVYTLTKPELKGEFKITTTDENGQIDWSKINYGGAFDLEEGSYSLVWKGEDLTIDMTDVTLTIDLNIRKKICTLSVEGTMKEPEVTPQNPELNVEGSVEELSEIIITWPDFESVAIADFDGQLVPQDVRADAITLTAEVAIDTEAPAVVLTPAEAVADGKYELVVKAGSFLLTDAKGNEVASEEIKATYDVATGIISIGYENGDAIWFNLQGNRVENPSEGLYIRVIGGKAEKVLVK